ncbi:glycosyltransferase [Candidatus Vecturithrix granuli]|uniref:Glycosyltransferase n=1 Tax=Vecturithrix granuli TaxID=1499967 RepID=A0A081BZY7_VECG1|nr:glycosyltransferase [Candidatus Vecturithrix granuli]
MKCIFICQEVDLSRPIQATAVTWIREFACHQDMEHVFVFTLRAGEFSLPDNVTVFSFQQQHRVGTLISFYAQIVHLLRSHHIDFFWVNQGGPYPVLLLPLKLLLHKPIFHWKAHPYIGPAMRFYARFCDTKIFTSTPTAFPMPLKKVCAVGQGIDTTQFRPLNVEKTGDLVTVGRIAASKQLLEIVEILKVCDERYGIRYRFDIYGEAFEKDRAYQEALQCRIAQYGLSSYVTLKGAIRHDQLPVTLNTYRVFLNFSKTALDKAVVEAMSCGLPVLTSNPCTVEIFPADVASLLVVPQENIMQQAEMLHALFSKSEAERETLGKRLREVVIQQHSVEGLIEKIVKEIKNTS